MASIRGRTGKAEYPHLGDTASFSSYDLTFHCRASCLAANGTKLDEHEEAIHAPATED